MTLDNMNLPDTYRKELLSSKSNSSHEILRSKPGVLLCDKAQI